MKRQLVDQALLSLDAIIRDELDGADVHKYTRIIAIAAQAHRMNKMGRTASNRVADVGGGHIGIVNGGLTTVGGGYYGDELQNALNGEPPEAAAPHPIGRLLGGGGIGHQPSTGDMMDMMREFAGSVIETDPVTIKSKKLKAILDAKQTMIDAGGDASMFDAKIQRLREEIAAATNEENEHGPDDHPALVRTELLRGYQAQGSEGRPVPADCGAGDGAGARSPGEPREGGIQATVVADVSEPA